MVRELSALFAMLRKKQEEIRQAGGAIMSTSPLEFGRNPLNMSERAITESANAPQACVGADKILSLQPWSYIVDFYDAFR